jgi:pimeloyl-ACP methyl ester carboxylesterase
MELVNPRTGVRHFYEIQGQGGPTVVLIHGWSANHRRFERLRDLLAQHCRVVCYDHRGHGLSQKHADLDYGLGALVLDLLGLLDALELERPVLAGHSMGGMVALQFARAFPQRVSALVLLGSAARVVRNPRERGSLLRAAWLCRHSYGFVSLVKDKGKRKRSDIFTDIQDPRFTPASAAAGLALMSVAHYDFREELQYIATPALAIATPRDDTVPFELTREMVRMLPNCRLAEIPNATHHFITENPHQTCDVMIEFIRQFS